MSIREISNLRTISVICVINLHTSCCGIPYEFMYLQLKLHRQTITENPFGEQPVFHCSEDGGHENGTSCRQAVLLHHILCPFVICFVRDNEFHFISCCQRSDIFPPVPLLHETARTFDVHNALDTRIDPRDVTVTAGFDHDFIVLIAQTFHQVVNVWLEERLAARDFHEPASVLFNFFYDRIDAQSAAFVKGIRRITPRTSEVARCQADERAGESAPRRFTLNAEENFVDDERVW